MTLLLINLHGLEGKLCTTMLKVLGSNPSEDKQYLLLEKLVIFLIFFEKFIFNTNKPKNGLGRDPQDLRNRINVPWESAKCSLNVPQESAKCSLLNS